MKKITGKKGNLTLTIISVVLSLLAVIVAIIVVVAGLKSGPLDGLALYKLDTSDLKFPSKLSSSDYLKDIQSISGADLTGPGSTAKSIGLAETYNIHILTVCKTSDGKTTCSEPEVGWWFNPKTTLKLDSSGFAGKYSDDFNDTLDAYKNAAYFMGFGFIISVVFAALSIILSGFGRRSRWLGISGAVLSWLATVLMLAAAVLTLITSRNMVKALSNELQDLGLDTSLGKLPYVSFIAFAFLFIASIFYALNAARQSRPSNIKTKSFAVGGEKSKHSIVDREVLGAAKPGLMQRVTTWTRHRYVQVERQPEITVTKHTNVREQSITMDSDEIHNTSSDYKNPAEERDIAMVPLTSSAGHRLDLAYEPYMSQSPGLSSHDSDNDRYDAAPEGSGYYGP